jgi:hypothetical protein
VTSTTATYGKTAASPNADFGGATSGTVTFEASPATGFTPVLKTIAIPVWADTRPEPDEQITITLSNLSGPAGTSLVRASGTGTIVETKPRTKG